MTAINTTRGVSFKPSGNNSKQAWLRRQALAAQQAAQIEASYQEYAPKQVFHQDEMTDSPLHRAAQELGINLTRRAA